MPAVGPATNGAVHVPDAATLEASRSARSSNPSTKQPQPQRQVDCNHHQQQQSTPTRRAAPTSTATPTTPVSRFRHATPKTAATPAQPATSQPQTPNNHSRASSPVKRPDSRTPSPAKPLFGRNEVLEVGRGKFYYRIDLPESKITPKKEGKGSGVRMSPVQAHGAEREEVQKGEVKDLVAKMESRGKSKDLEAGSAVVPTPADSVSEDEPMAFGEDSASQSSGSMPTEPSTPHTPLTFTLSPLPPTPQPHFLTCPPPNPRCTSYPTDIGMMMRGISSLVLDSHPQIHTGLDPHAGAKAPISSDMELAMQMFRSPTVLDKSARRLSSPPSNISPWNARARMAFASAAPKLAETSSVPIPTAMDLVKTAPVAAAASAPAPATHNISKPSTQIPRIKTQKPHGTKSKSETALVAKSKVTQGTPPALMAAMEAEMQDLRVSLRRCVGERFDTAPPSVAAVDLNLLDEAKGKTAQGETSGSQEAESGQMQAKSQARADDKSCTTTNDSHIATAKETLRARGRIKGPTKSTARTVPPSTPSTIRTTTRRPILRPQLQRQRSRLPLASPSKPLLPSKVPTTTSDHQVSQPKSHSQAEPQPPSQTARPPTPFLAPPRIPDLASRRRALEREPERDAHNFASAEDIADLVGEWRAEERTQEAMKAKMKAKTQKPTPSKTQVKSKLASRVKEKVTAGAGKLQAIRRDVAKTTSSTPKLKAAGPVPKVGHRDKEDGMGKGTQVTSTTPAGSPQQPAPAPAASASTATPTKKTPRSPHKSITSTKKSLSTPAPASAPKTPAPAPPSKLRQPISALWRRGAAKDAAADRGALRTPSKAVAKRLDAEINRHLEGNWKRRV